MNSSHKLFQEVSPQCLLYESRAPLFNLIIFRDHKSYMQKQQLSNNYMALIINAVIKAVKPQSIMCYNSRFLNYLIVIRFVGINISNVHYWILRYSLVVFCLCFHSYLSKNFHVDMVTMGWKTLKILRHTNVALIFICAVNDFHVKAHSSSHVIGNLNIIDPFQKLREKDHLRRPRVN